MKGVINMTVTATEFKQNLGKYLLLSEHEDIYITQYGKLIAKLVSTNKEREDIARSLFGVIPDSMTPEEAKEKRGEDL